MQASFKKKLNNLNSKNTRNIRKKRQKQFFRNNNQNNKNTKNNKHNYYNNKHFLQTFWCIYAHDKLDKDFSDNSYKKVFIINTIEDFWIFFNNVHDFTRHQFYIMRENIPPKYECTENIHGGSWSYLINNSEDIQGTLIQVIIRMIGETLVPENYYRHITGLYLMTKPTNGAILKIWVKNCDTHINLNLDNICTLCSKRFRKHQNLNNF